jgi:hypothetical protein
LLVLLVSGAATVLDRLRRVTFFADEPERSVPGFLSGIPLLSFVLPLLPILRALFLVFMDTSGPSSRSKIDTASVRVRAVHPAPS